MTKTKIKAKIKSGFESNLQPDNFSLFDVYHPTLIIQN